MSTFDEATIRWWSWAGPVLAPLQDYTHYDAARLAGTANKDAAAAFLTYGTGPAAAAAWKAASSDSM